MTTTSRRNTDDPGSRPDQALRGHHWVAVSLVTVFGLGLGGIIRRTAGATTALMLATIGSQNFGIALPAGARQYLPGAVIQAIVTVKQTSGLLAPGTAVAVLAAYAVVILAIASRLIAARDA